jgi:hypothetical protein
MSDGALTEEQYIRFLSLAPTDLLAQAGSGMIIALQNLPEDSPEAEAVAIMLMMLGREYDLRQVEPLWRKAQRFAVRNSETFKQVGKIAACIGAGAILGVSLDNS